MPWDPYFRSYFRLWQTFLHLRLRTFDFFEIPAWIFLQSSRTACNFRPLCPWTRGKLVQKIKSELLGIFLVRSGAAPLTSSADGGRRPLAPLGPQRECQEHSGEVSQQQQPQVWPLTHFCWKKSLICLEGKLLTPHRGNTIIFCSSQQLHRLRLGPLKGFLSWYGALQGPSSRLVRCFWNYRDKRTPSGLLR